MYMDFLNNSLNFDFPRAHENRRFDFGDTSI